MDKDDGDRNSVTVGYRGAWARIRGPHLLAVVVGLLMAVATLGFFSISSDLRAHNLKQDGLAERITTGLRVMCENAAATPAQVRNCQNIR